MFRKKKNIYLGEQAPNEEELQYILKNTEKYIIPSSPQPEIKILTNSYEIKHLKKQFWKFSHRY